MARYRLLSKSYFDAPVKMATGEVVAGVVLDVGAEIDFPGIPAPHFEPLDDDAKLARMEFDEKVIEGLKPISREEELEREAVNPLQPPEMQRQAAEFRKQARAKEAAAVKATRQAATT
jgi:hypothetical protein